MAAGDFGSLYANAFTGTLEGTPLEILPSALSIPVRL